jgi:hypothetical protein
MIGMAGTPAEPITQSMKLPRWTVYPALAVIGTLLFTALPNTAESPEGNEDAEGAALRARASIIEQAADGELLKIQEMTEARASEFDEALQSATDQ